MLNSWYSHNPSVEAYLCCLETLHLLEERPAFTDVRGRILHINSVLFLYFLWNIFASLYFAYVSEDTIRWEIFRFLLNHFLDI